MPQDNLPPLRIREADGSPNVIPVFDVILSNNLTLQNNGGGIVTISATTGAGGSSVIYAATGNTYIVTDLASDLTNEFRLVQSGNSITISTAGNLIIINASTGNGSTNPAGGDGAFQVNSQGAFYGNSSDLYFQISSARFGIGTTSPLSKLHIFDQGSNFLEMNNATANGFGPAIFISKARGNTAGAATVVSQDTLGVINFRAYDGADYIVAARIIGIQANSAATNSVDGNLMFVTRHSGGTLNQNMLITSTGSVIIGTGVTDNTYKFQIMGSTRILDLLNMTTNKIINLALCTAGSDAANKHYVDANTGGGTSTQVISIPMALLSVEVNSGNTFWNAQTDGTRMDKAYVNMTDSGRSISTWWCEMPRNLNATPAWGVDITGEAALLGATGGFLVLNVDGMSAAVGESSNTLAASTIQLVAAGSFQLNTAGILSICTLTATNFDAALATSATDYVKIKLARQGNADTFNSDWYIYNVKINCTVDT